LFSTAYAPSVHRSPARMHKTLAPLTNCIVSDALVDVTPHLLHTLFQFVSVVQPRLVHSLLDDAPDPVINRIKVKAVRWPVERTTALLEKSQHNVACWCAGCPDEGRKIPDTCISRVVAALTGAHHGSKCR